MPLFRPTICEINSAALRHNYRQLKKLAGNREVVGVVKANAYGHGAAHVARILATEGVSIFGVATVEEGIELRRSGISGRILCFGGPLGASVQDLLEFGLEPVIFNEETLKLLGQQLQNSEKTLSIHLKVDTGMGRLGILPADLDKVLGWIAENSRFELVSVMTHLARADEQDPKPTDEQISLFLKIEEKTKALGFSSIAYHFTNSAALIDEKLNLTQWVRPGIAMYGAYPNERFEKQVELKPVLNWKTQIISLKEFPEGSPISYGATFITRRPSKVAVIPVGYADGYSRFFSNKGVLLVRGQRVPVLGRVCMDLTMIDVTDLPVVELGDEVVLIGKQKEECLKAEELAGILGTIPYDIFCSISARVPRLLLNHQGDSHE